jgi:hypothetical protein
MRYLLSILFMLAIGLNSLPPVFAVSYTFRPIIVPGSSTTQPEGINDSDQIVGTSAVGGVSSGFLETLGTFATVTAPDGTFAGPSDIDGNKIFGQTNVGGFVKTDRVFTTIQFQDVRSGPFVLGGNKAGQAVGQFTDVFGDHSFLLNPDGSLRTLALPTAVDINNAGQIAGYNMFFAGFVLNPDGSLRAFTLPGFQLVTGINDAGDVIGTFSEGLSTNGFILRSDGTFSILRAPDTSAPFARDIIPRGINDAGEIVGYVDLGLNNFQGFLATPIINPEPSTWVLLSSGLAGLLLWRRWRNSELTSSVHL